MTQFMNRFPTLEEFEANDYQRGHYHTLLLAEDILFRKFESAPVKTPEVEAFRGSCLKQINELIRTYGPPPAPFFTHK